MSKKEVDSIVNIPVVLAFSHDQEVWGLHCKEFRGGYPRQRLSREGEERNP